MESIAIEALMKLGTFVSREDQYRQLADACSSPAILIEYMSKVKFRGNVFFYIRDKRLPALRDEEVNRQECGRIVTGLEQVGKRFTHVKDTIQKYFDKKLDAENELFETWNTELVAWREL